MAQLRDEIPFQSQMSDRLPLQLKQQQLARGPLFVVKAADGPARVLFDALVSAGHDVTTSEDVQPKAVETAFHEFEDIGVAFALLADSREGSWAYALYLRPEAGHKIPPPEISDRFRTIEQLTTNAVRRLYVLQGYR